MKNIFYIILLLFLLSCEDPMNIADDSDLDSRIDGLELSFETIHQDNTTLTMNNQRRFLVFKSREEENNFFNEFPIQNSPWNLAIDYENEMVIGIAMEPQAHGGVHFSIDSLRDENSKILVYSSLHISQFGPTIQTYPVHFIKLNKYDNEVIFKDITIIDDSNNLPLENTEWELLSFTTSFGDEYTRENADIYFGDEVDFSEAYIEFDDDEEFSGQAFCNEMVNDGDGYYRVINPGSRLELKFSATEIACAGTVEFQEALYNSINYFADENFLTINCDSEITSLKFTRKRETPTNNYSLKNTKWKLSYWIDDNGIKRTDVNGNYNFGPQVDRLDHILEIGNSGFRILENFNILEGKIEYDDRFIEFLVQEKTGIDTDFSEYFLNAISNTEIYTSSEDSLEIICDNSPVNKLVFERYEIGEITSNIYGEWQLVLMIKDGEFVNVPPRGIGDNRNSIWMYLGEDGSINGKAVCNQFSGEFMHGNFTFRTKPLASTKAMCPPSSEFIETLSGAINFSISEDGLGLVLYSDSDAFEQALFIKY